MSTTVGEIRINLTAGTSQFVQDLVKANGSMKEFGSKAKESAGEAKGAMALLGEELGINLPRHARNFLAELPGISTAMNAAFSSVAVIAIGVAVFEAGKKVVEFFTKMSEAKDKSEQAWRSFSKTLKDANDETTLSIARLNAETAKLTGKRENTVAILLDEARVNADHLADSLDADIEKLTELLKKQNVGMFAQIFENKASTSGNAEGADRFREQVADADGDASKIKAIAQGEVDRLTKKLGATQALQDIHEGKNQAPSYQQYVHSAPGTYAPYGEQANTPDQKDQIKQLKEQLAEAKRVKDAAALSIDHTSSEGSSTKAKADKDALEQQKKLAEQRKAEIEKESNMLKAAYDDQLAVMESSGKVSLTDRVDHYEAELAELSKFGTRYAALKHEIEVKTGSVWQEIIKQNDEDGHRLAESDNEWAKRAKDAMAALGKTWGDPTTNLRGDKLPNVLDEKPIDRLKGTPQGMALDLKDHGFNPVSNQEHDIKESETSLSIAQAIQQPLALQLEIRKQILEQQIALNQEQGKNSQQQQADLAKLQAQQTLMQWSNIGMGTAEADVINQLMQLPQQMAGSLVSSIFDAPKKGESKGTEILHGLGKTAEEAGKGLATKLLTDGIEKLVATIIPQSLFMSAQTIAENANTAALIANTAAQGISGGASAAGGIASGVGSAAGGVASAASSGLSAAATGLAGPLIQAGASLIAGVMTSVTTWLGDNRIVKAVNAVQTAVEALGGKFGGGSSLNSSTSGTTGTGTQSSTSSNGLLSTLLSGGIPVIGGLTQSLFGFGGGSGSQPIPVSIERINPMAPLSGLFHMFGFAGGTDSAPGGLSWVGEDGPELLNLRPGSQVIPNHKTAGYLRGLSGPGMPEAYSLRSMNTMSANSGPSGATHTTHSYVHNGDIVMHGVNDPEDMLRQVHTTMKTKSSKFAQFSH